MAKESYATYDSEEKYAYELKPGVGSMAIADAANLAVDTDGQDFAMKTDYTRANTVQLRQITKRKRRSFSQHFNIARKALKRWKKQFRGLTWKESVMRFIMNVSHAGISVGTIIYCVVLVLILGSTILGNLAAGNNAYNYKYLFVALNCIMGAPAVFFGCLPAVLIFDYALSCAGFGFALTASWQINDGINENGNNSTLVVFGLIMIMAMPFRVFWWHKYYPNKYGALELYSRMAAEGLIKNVTFDDEEEDEFLGDSRPSLDTSTAEEKFDSLMASVSTSYKGKKVAIHEDEDEEEESTKLTEYEIFQKLQLKESSKTEKKRVECSECGKMLPVNTIKRHLLKHEKDALMEKEGSATGVEEAPVKSKPQPKPRGRKKNNSGTRNRKQEPKHLKKEEEEKKSESIKGHDEDDERIQCPLNLKKMIMKRHLMKPEADTEDTVKHEKKVEEKDETDGVKPPAASKGRKKKLASSPSVAKRQIERQTKTKKKAMDDPEMYAPIEITPTKEYWEYEKEKREKSFDFPSADDNDLGPSKKLRKGSDLEIRNKSLQDLKDAEKSRNTSEEESESENSLDAAVRKVVSYRMTPKQALSHYNLTPKVLFDSLLGETDEDRLSILTKVDLGLEREAEVITFCRDNEEQLSYRAVINLVRELKTRSGESDFTLSRLEAYRWWYAFRKKHDLKITAKKK